MDYLSVKDFERFQHYKDRAPPWIKFYASLLDNYEWACLQDASKAHLAGIWLLASKTDNKVPADPEWIAKRIGATEPVDLQPLVQYGFIEVSSNMLASCKQGDDLETETETETEGDNKGADAPVSSFTYLMGVCREVGLDDMKANGSILKVLLVKYKCGMLEGAIRGLRLVNEDYKSLLPLHSAKFGEGVWAEAVQRYGQSIKETPPKAKEAKEDPQQTAGLFAAYQQ